MAWHIEENHISLSFILMLKLKCLAYQLSWIWVPSLENARRVLNTITVVDFRMWQECIWWKNGWQSNMTSAIFCWEVVFGEATGRSSRILVRVQLNNPDETHQNSLTAVLLRVVPSLLGYARGTCLPQIYFYFSPTPIDFNSFKISWKTDGQMIFISPASSAVACSL